MYNQLTIVGNLGRDPSFKEFDSGSKNCTFSVATKEYKGETQWHNVVVWGNQADSCKQYLSKGSMVLVTGPIRSRKYTTRDGDERTLYELIANNVRFIQTNPKQSDNADGNPVRDAPSSEVDDDDIPF